VSMRELAVNEVFRLSDSDRSYRVLWISRDQKNAYIFDMNTLEMPTLTSYSELRRQADDGILTLQENALDLSVVNESELSEGERAVRDEIWGFIYFLTNNNGSRTLARSHKI